MTIDEAFNASVAYYDEWMMKALPNYEDIFGTALALLPFEPEAALDVLDLGAGTGLFSKHVLWKYPRSNFVLVDLADKMLDLARERFGKNSPKFKYVLGDYRKLDEEQEYGLIISSLSIYHLHDDKKKALFGCIHTILRKGGIFINVDQI
jgi:tRNA (cmo5U34)-methyltransferase